MLSCLRTLLLIAAGTLMLSWPAFYNGYPLQWYDSEGYLNRAWSGSYPSMIRSPFYSIGITPLLALNSEWPIVFVQAALAAAMVLLVLRTVSGRLQAGHYLAAIGLLALLTSLSWHSSYIMADVFAGLVPLGMFLLAFARDRLAWWEVAFVFAVTSVASLVHYSHVPLALGLAAVAVGILLLERRPAGDVIRSAGCCLAVAAVIVTAQIGAQWALAGRMTISPGGSIFLLARLVEDGPARDYLAADCPQANFKLCAFVNDMPMDANRFLWGDGPVRSLGGFGALVDEAPVVVAGTLRLEPLRVAWLSLGNILRQLATFGMSGYSRSFRSPYYLWQQTERAMQDHLPGEVDALRQSREASGSIGLRGLFELQWATVAVSGVWFALLYLAGSRADRRIRELMWITAAALITNAAICGVLSGPSDRYQSRMIWLVPFLLCVAVLTAVNARRTLPSGAP
jgi:hypothetical protein